MKPEVKKAFDLIKENCSKEEQIKELFTDKDGDVDLSKLDLTGLNVNLNELKARLISNRHQQAEWITNRHQQAEYAVCNSFQESKWISNYKQQAEYISNKNQKLN